MKLNEDKEKEDEKKNCVEWSIVFAPDAHDKQNSIDDQSCENWCLIYL